MPARPWPTYLLLAAILLASLGLHVNNLGHAGMKDLDEAYHAVVARSMLDDPLKPTLYATPYLPYDYTNWQANHVWLHKPPVALWQIAGSLALFGESNFTLRLPSALLATAAVALTFLIGRALFDARAGLAAAALQALAPALTRLVHGQVFADHVDVAMLFWSEAAVLLLVRAARSGRTSDAALVGVAQAIAWMTKSYPALFVAGLATLLCLAGPWLNGRDGARRLGLSRRNLLVLIVTALVTAAPWVAWCVARYPREFAFEQGHVFSHLVDDVEAFAAPWDRLLADYLHRGFLEWFPLAIVATGLVTWDALRKRDARRLFAAAWAFGVLVPHLLATSKTPTATLVGWPAGWLAIGVLVSDASRGRAFALGAAAAAGALLVAWPQRPLASVMGYGADYHFARILIERWPLVACAAGIFAGGWIARRAIGSDVTTESLSQPGPRADREERRPSVSRRTIAVTLVAFVVLFAFPAYRYARVAVLTSRDVPKDPVAFPRLGTVVRALAPREAVFLVDEQSRGEAILAMWWLDRACYPLRHGVIAADVATIRANGGVPFILSRRARPEPQLPGIAGEATIYVP